MFSSTFTIVIRQLPSSTWYPTKLCFRQNEEGKMELAKEGNLVLEGVKKWYWVVQAGNWYQLACRRIEVTYLSLFSCLDVWSSLCSQLLNPDERVVMSALQTILKRINSNSQCYNMRSRILWSETVESLYSKYHHAVSPFMLSSTSHQWDNHQRGVSSCQLSY